MKRIVLVIAMLICALGMMVGCGFLTNGDNSKTSVETKQTTKTDSKNKAEEKTEKVEMVVPKGIPVLMYHKIGPDKDNDAVIAEDLFRAQMKYLKDNGYHPITMQQLYDYMKDGKAVPVKPVALNFDDGYADTYTIAYPILKEYKFPATVYLNPGDVGTRLTWEQAKEMHENGFEVASHGFMHEEMGNMTNEQQKANIVKAQQAFKEKLGITPTQFCYPYSSYNDYTMKALREEGLIMSTTMNSGWAHYGDDVMQVKRVWIGNAVDLKHFEERLTTEHYSNL